MTREHFHDEGEAWDYDQQREDTDWMFRDLKGKKLAQPGQAIDLDIQFIPVTSGASADRFVDALRRSGFEAASWREDGEDLVEATAKKAEFSISSIWGHEKRATEIAVKHGFAPDGWGFSDEDDR
ncbi:MAG: hypothetical protein ACJAVR_001278 [Paracoccaceae bacterium]|jgi:hypothetical protein